MLLVLYVISLCLMSLAVAHFQTAISFAVVWLFMQTSTALRALRTWFIGWKKPASPSSESVELTAMALRHLLNLSRQDQETFVNAILNPSEPNDKLREAAEFPLKHRLTGYL